MTSTRKLIIEIQGELSDEQALDYVIEVVLAGRQSENRHGKHYCWLTVFHKERDVKVIVREKQYKSSTDSFIVRKTV